MMELIRSGLRNISRLKALALIFIFALTTANIAKAQQAPPSEHEKSTAQEITPEENTPEDEVDIQDSAEYQAYINALNTLDAAARLSAFEAFVRNFPKSALRPYALQRAMQARIELDNERTAPLQQELRQLRAAYEQAPHQPTPQQRACEMLHGIGAEGLSFQDWEFVLQYRDSGAPCNREAAERVWREIENKQRSEDGSQAKLLLPVRVLSSIARTIDAALTEDNQKAQRSDLRIIMGAPMAKPPARGAVIHVEGVISDYSITPFAFIMTQGTVTIVEQTGTGGFVKSQRQDGSASH